MQNTNFAQAFLDYQNQHSMDAVRSQLKSGLDKVSCEYIDSFERLLEQSLHGEETNSLWTTFDQESLTKIEHFSDKHLSSITISPQDSNIQLSGPITIDCYDLSNLPQEVLSKVNGKSILDCGELGEQLLPVYKSLFPNSQVYYFANKNQTLASLQANHQVQVIESEQINLDSFINAHNLEVGLIKLNLSGEEKAGLQGALQCLKEQKPLLLATIFHTPQSFYELKGVIESLELGYHFMVRRSFIGQTYCELMLIAY